MEKKQKPKMGRPKSANPANKQMPRIRVTVDQLNNYREASKRAGKTLSAWAKDLMDRASEKSK